MLNAQNVHAKECTLYEEHWLALRMKSIGLSANQALAVQETQLQNTNYSRYSSWNAAHGVIHVT